MKRILLLSAAALCCLTFAAKASVTPSFTASSTYICPGGSVVYTNTTVVPPGHHVSFYWTFSYGLPVSDNHFNPISAVVFGTPGAPMVQLQAYDSSDNSYSYYSSASVTVLPMPAVSIAATPASAIVNCIADSVILHGVESDTTGRIVWTLPSSITDTAKTISTHVGGNYQVVSIDSSGCVSWTQNIWVTVQTPIAAEIGVYSPMTGMTFPTDSTSLCTGTGQLEATWSGAVYGAPIYSWSNGAVTSLISPSTSGEYKLTITDANGCTGKDSLYVTVNTTPSDSIYPSTTAILCSGDSVILRAVHGSYTYSWQNLYTGSITTADSVILTSTVYYGLTVTGAGGCTASNSYNATFNPSPSPVFSVTPTVGYATGLIMDTARICANGGSSITATPMDYYPTHSYHWSNGDTVATFPVTSTGKLILTVSNSAGCTSKDSIYISSSSAPDSTISPLIIGTLCSGMVQDLSVHAVPGITTHWSTGSIDDSIIVTADGSYTATITNSAGCISHGTSTVYFNPTPTPSVSVGPCSAAVGSIVSGDFYQWSSITSGIIPGATSPFYGASASGFYAVKETTPAGCSATASFAYVTCGTIGGGVSTDSIHAYFAESTALLCHSGTITFTNLTSAINPSTIKYTWTFPGGTPDTSTLSVPPSVSFSPGTHTVSLIAHDTVSGEISTFASSITVDSVAISAYGYSPVTSYYTTGDTARICFVDSPEVGVLVTEGTLPTYVWSNGSTAAKFYENVSGKYKVTVTDSYGCSVSDSIYLIVNPSPDTTTTISGGHCVGDTVHVSVPTGNTYLWTTSETTHAISVTASGVYGLTITSPAGCIAHQTYPVIFNALPSPLITVSPAVYSYGALDTAHVCVSTPSSITVSPYGSFSYSWSTGSSLSGFPVTSGTGVYAVTVTDMYSGCSAKDSVFIWIHADPDSTVTASISGTLCEGMTQVLHAVSGYSYVWSNGATTDTLAITMGGMYEVNLTNSYGCTSHSSTYTANFINLDEPYIAIDPSGCTLACSTTFTADSFAWYLNGVQLAGINSQYITASDPGFYSARAFQNGCSALSGIVYAEGCTSGVSNVTQSVGIKVFPNPFMESVSVEGQGEIIVTLVNTLGQIVSETTGKNTVVIPTANVVPGMYEISVRDTHGTLLKTAKIIKQ